MKVTARPDYRRLPLRQAYREAWPHCSEGYPYTKYIIRVPATFVSVLALRYGVHPSVVSLGNMAIAGAASLMIIIKAAHAHEFWLAGLAACICWQFAYILDSVDGQTARASGKSSEFGARLDVLADLFVHCVVVAALLRVSTRLAEIPVSLIAICAVLWTVNLFVGVLTRTDQSPAHSFTSGHGPLEGLKIVRDSGFLSLVVGLWLFFDPATIWYPVLAISLVNGVFLLVSIAREAWLSLHPDRSHASSTATDKRLSGLEEIST